MFRLFCIIILLTLNTLTANASPENNIKAIVNHETITVEELLMRKIVMRTINGMGQLPPEQEKAFTDSILQGMIQDKIILQTSQQMGIYATDDEVNEYIATLEQRNQMPAHYMRDNLPKEMFSDFTKKIRNNVLKTKLIQRVVTPNISIPRRTTDKMAILADGKDAELSLYIATTDNAHNADFNKIQKLRSKLFQLKCFDPKTEAKYQEFQKIDTTLSQLTAKQASIIRDIEVGQVSSIIKDGEHLQAMKLCAKRLQEYGPEEQQKMLAFVGNHKLQLQAERYLKSLHRRSYIKIK